MKTLRTTTTSLLLAALLGGCAGGGETGTGLTAPDSIVSLGSITGFGSVYVNGVHFQTTGSSVSLNGSGANETDLKIGMVVKIRGNIGSNGVYDGVATAIEYENELKGQVTTVDSVNGTITVMGQTVIMDNQTQIEGALAVALYNMVEVSGYADGLGNVHATLIEVKSNTYTPGEEIELKGTVSALSTNTKTFNIGAQPVSYDGVGGITLQDGALVEIKSTTGFVGGKLIASRIEVKNINGREFEGQEGQELELEGLVTAIDTGNNTITVNGYTVTVDSSIINLFSVGSRIEVKGQFDSNGQLILAEYEERISSDLELEGIVSLVPQAPNHVAVFNKPFVINNQTIMNDERDEGYTPLHYFSIKDLVDGERVEIRAFENENGLLIATRLDRINDSLDPYSIKGPITAIDLVANTITIKNKFTIDISAVIASLSGKVVGDEVELSVNANMVAVP